MARAQLDVLLDERVPVFASGLGNPAFILEAAHARGMKVFGLIGKTRQAEREIEAGVDAIIAQGYDAAGHTGTIGTFSIVPEVAAIAGDTPVIAGGGVTTGRHLAAALCLGRLGRLDRHALARVARVRRGHDHQGEAARGHGRGHHVLAKRLGHDDARAEVPVDRGVGEARGAARRSAAPYQMLLSADYIQGANDHRRAGPDVPRPRARASASSPR